MDWVIDFETTALDMWHKLGNETPTPNPMAGGAPMPAAPMPAPMQAPGSGAMPPSGMPQIDPAMQAAPASGGDPDDGWPVHTAPRRAGSYARPARNHTK